MDVPEKHQHVPLLFWSLTLVVGMVTMSVNVNPVLSAVSAVLPGSSALISGKLVADITNPAHKRAIAAKYVFSIVLGGFCSIMQTYEISTFPPVHIMHKNRSVI